MEDDLEKEFEQGLTDDNKPADDGVQGEAPEATEKAKATEAEETKKEELDPAGDAAKGEGADEPAAEVTEPPTPTGTENETPAPITKDDLRSVISELKSEERNSTKELETQTKDVLEKFYPEGLSNVLVDEATGREIKTPQDVVDLSNGSMSTEEAAKWLMNEQYRIDNEVAKIKDQARGIAETTLNFKRDSIASVKKYEPLFKWQPHLQNKMYDLMMKQVKIDEKKGVVLSAPDVMDLYDTYLEPYQQAYEFSQNKPATNPVPQEAPPAPPKPGQDDRLDVSGDGGPAEVNDPNDFVQQVGKELAKGI